MVDVRIEIDDLLTASPVAVAEAAGIPQKPRSWPQFVGWTSALLLSAFAIAFWYAARPDASVSLPVGRSVIPFPTDALLRIERWGSAVALSPDGTRLVYVVDRNGKTQLYQHRFDQFDATPIAGTEGGNGPFFSPDGQWVGFFADDKLMKVSLLDAKLLPICNVTSGMGRGASWGADGKIIFGETRRGLLRVSASGGNAEVLSREGVWPEILPGGKDVLLTILNRGSFDDASLAVLSLKTGKLKTLGPKGTNPRYARSGHLVFEKAAALWVVPFDSAGTEVRGAPVRVVEGIFSSATSGAAHFSLSSAGSLAYVPVANSPNQGSLGSLVWVNRQGKSTPLPFPPCIYEDARLSPVGDRLALTVNGQEVWIYDVLRGTRTRLTGGEGDSFEAIWKPDGTRVAFSSRRAGVSNVFSKLADGRGEVERLTTSDYDQFTSSWTPDGKTLFFAQSGLSGIDVWMLHPDGSERKVEPFLN